MNEETTFQASFPQLTELAIDQGLHLEEAGECSSLFLIFFFLAVSKYSDGQTNSSDYFSGTCACNRT